jgi:hypothetical protein
MAAISSALRAAVIDRQIIDQPFPMALDAFPRIITDQERQGIILIHGGDRFAVLRDSISIDRGDVICTTTATWCQVLSITSETVPKSFPWLPDWRNSKPTLLVESRRPRQ